MKTKKNRKFKGGTPRILKITGYYDGDNDNRQLIDFRVEKVKDKEAAEKYWEKHKVSIDPPKGLLEEVLDLFNFNQVYTNKALKRVDAFLSKPDPNKTPITETRYVMVNDNDDIDKIKITNQLIQRLALMKQQGKISGGAGEEEENKLRESEKTEINKLKEQLINEFNEKDKEGISAIDNSPGFTRILGEYVKIDRNKLPLDTDVLAPAVAPAVTSDNSIPQNKLDEVLEIVKELAKNVNTLTQLVTKSDNQTYVANNSVSDNTNAPANANAAVANTTDANTTMDANTTENISRTKLFTETLKSKVPSIYDIEFMKKSAAENSPDVKKIKQELLNDKYKKLQEDVKQKKEKRQKDIKILEERRIAELEQKLEEAQKSSAQPGGKKKTNKRKKTQRRKKRNTKRV